MSGPSSPQAAPVTSKTELIEYLASGAKPRDQWRIGTEHEKFAFAQSDHRPLPYDGPCSIRAMLEGLTRFGWTPILEGDTPIALTMGGASITLEPGGQFELSGDIMETLHQTCREVHQHLDQVKEVAAEIGAGFLGVGFQPKWSREDTPWMPKGRYKIMKAYMPTQGNLGLDMMLRTCTIQVNLDFESEADMVEKFRIGLALQPIVTALFANSPFTDGKPNGYLSYRSHVWTDTDVDRCGTLPFVFENGFGFERYVDYMLDVPMYFVYRDGTYIDASGQSFRDFMAGKLPALPGVYPTIKDWEDHMTTVFPEVRLKKFLEMRGADGGPWRRICALPAFWVGLLYDAEAQAAAAALISDWQQADHEYLRAEVPKHALSTEFRGKPLADLAAEVVALSHAGLTRREKLDDTGTNESYHLKTLEEILERGKTPAEVKLALYHDRWQENVDPVFEEYAY
ncbi:MAG: glutamate--cysteine ligase [Rhodospirillales bacterium]|jgi:glutamate--cysteine ligase|nr:glutamate--cysteine ligase [Rhodospirillales bacterium]MBT5075227.1 glutamate--cysteine ligase [Rhodospirillales bacterium]MBT5113956.1 glutamate--cysteine ligase [Rhodospirillales bacterium]MBT5672484.1 glutamate--cysteine ligase [Rhodospirillales bacterium]MBT6185847.1 glutamate--cysteine ligase [Rhodospirillales bacterium]